MRVLVLGGTGEARALAAGLHAAGADVVSSLAGRVSNPTLPVGRVRIGGFGGADGLAGYLRTDSVAAMVDATHPFAVTITSHAVRAAAATGCPLLVVRRAGWLASPDDAWTRVPHIAAAAAAVRASSASTVLLTTGRRDLAAFARDRTRHYVVRAVEAPTGAMPPRLTVVLSRGPYRLAGEVALLAEHRVELLVTKDSGGELTVAKLVAARQRRVPVVMVDRPAPPVGVAMVADVAGALAWVDARLTQAG